MKHSILTATVCVLCASYVLSPSSALAKTHTCTAQVYTGQQKITFKKGRGRGAGFTLQTKFLDDGSIRISAVGETAFLRPDGTVVGRNGTKTGNHTCDLAAIRAQRK